jgi:hypothetical protein
MGSLCHKEAHKAHKFRCRLKVSLFHLEAPDRRPTARRAGGRVRAHAPPHPRRRQRTSRELRDSRVYVYYLRCGERLFIINLDRIARSAAHVRPVEGDARAREKARIRRWADERRRGQRAGRRGRRRDGQRRRAAYAAVSRGDRDAGVRSDARGVDAEGRTRGARRDRDAGRH